MRPFQRAFVLGITASLVVVSARPAARSSLQDERPAFRASADSVSVSVSVRRQNRPVTGLRIPDFEVMDSGVKQEIVDLSYEKLPIDLTIALDISGSVSGRVLDDLRRSVQQLRSGLAREDRLRVITFNMRVRELVELGATAAAVDTAFAGVRAFGSSAVVDSLAVALTLPAPVDRRQLIVLFSDGEETSSILDPAGLMDVAARTSPTVSVVLPALALNFAGPPGVRAGQTRQTYRDLATATGGTLVTIVNRADLSSTFRSVLDDFRSSYVLHFRPTGVTPGGLHALEVHVQRDGVEIRARREYFW